MKKLLLTTMIAALLALPMGSVALATAQETAAPETELIQEADFVPGGVPAETDALESMTPAIHAVLLAMLNEDQTTFDAGSSLSWEILYNMLSLYGQLDDRAEYRGEDLVIPVETVMDFAAALFPDFEALGPLSEDLADRMVYDSEIDSYLVTCGSDSLAEIRLTSAERTGSGLELTGALVYLVDSSDLAPFHATLQPRDNMFGYTIAALELL